MYKNLMEVEKPSKEHKLITVENDATLAKRLVAIFFGPALLAGMFWGVFIIEKFGHHPSSDLTTVLLEYIYTMFTQGNTECLPSLDYIIVCSIIFGPFAFFISYKWWKVLRTKVILSSQGVFKKPPTGPGLQLKWNEIKKIYITENTERDFFHLIFTRKKRYRPFDNKNYIVLDAHPMSKKNWLWDAAGLILEKIDLYKIPIKGERKLLEEIVKEYSKSSPGPARPAVSNKAARKSLRAGSSSPQTPTPKL